MRWPGHVAGKDIKVAWWEYLKEETFLKRPWRRWEDDIKFF